ncbi:MAG: thiamine diphosphokinase [Clostridia bacterium]|nr:thiamine diphosphokinase [Clostridia bacterium]
MQKRAFIYIGGHAYEEHVEERPAEGDLVIAADAGLLTARRMGVHVDLAVGDFDTLGAPDVEKETEVVRLPAEKDVTDTQYAVELALRAGVREIVFVGSLEGRLDHTLSLLGILESLWERKEGRVLALATNGKNRVRFFRDSGTILPRSQYRYFSVLAADPVVKGVTLEGCKYPLSRAKITRVHQFAVSNEIVGNCALVEVRRGGVFVVESMD